MQTEQLRHCLESAEKARGWLQAWGLRDGERGWRNLTHLAESLGLDCLRDLISPLGRFLPRCPDADMAMNNLERFLAARPDTLPALLEHRGRSLEVLLQVLATSQGFSDSLIGHPDCLALLGQGRRLAPSAAELRDGLQSEVDAAADDAAIPRAFRRFRQRQLLRVGASDLVRERPLEEVTADLSRVADVALDVALATASRAVAARFGEPAAADGQAARCAILAFGKLGGEELNYSSDLDVVCLYDEEGTTRGRKPSIGNDEFFARVVSEVLRLLSSQTDRGQGYRIDLRLRPEGKAGPLARSLASTLSYYDTRGRTWERQALIKARPVAGDLALGGTFLRTIEPFVYRKYLSFAEINEIKALKRRIEHKASHASGSHREVKTGHGGIRDIEFTIQFLQLLNGGDLPDVRQPNTLRALGALEAAGCLTDQEYRVLDDAYRFLRKTEHRLQILFDLQTHRLPDAPDELRKLALRMGYAVSEGRDPLDAFLADYRDKTEPTRRILDHLVHQTFAGDAEYAEPESDLLLDPSPDPETTRVVLGRYGFRDVPAAYHNLTRLAEESGLFLSTRRCRHFLASIAPSLLRAVADTPDPDMALNNLEKVTASLGAKTVLWELFSFNPPSLKLYVDLCAWSQFLSEILINNPGMIDELLDTLVLNQPRSRDELGAELAELCKGAADLEPILHSFQDTELLRVGVRDVLGKDTIRETTAALSDLAETILEHVVRSQQGPTESRLGVPVPGRFALLALGKLGGRELNYHSDLDLILVYEADGRTTPPRLPGADRFAPTDNFHFFTELAQRVIRATSTVGPMGRLYQVDMRLRPTGRSGSLVVSMAEFRRYYDTGGAAQLWERQALTRARVVYGDEDFALAVRSAAEGAAYGLDWRPELADELIAMRHRLEASRGERDLKRGFGGLVDVEFLVQLCQLRYGRVHAELRTPNMWEAFDGLLRLGLLSTEEYAALRDGYDFLLRVQSKLRIVHNRSLDEVPGEAEEVAKLARRLGYTAERFLAELDRHTHQVRDLMRRIAARERTPVVGAG